VSEEGLYSSKRVAVKSLQSPTYRLVFQWVPAVVWSLDRLREASRARDISSNPVLRSGTQLEIRLRSGTCFCSLQSAQHPAFSCAVHIFSSFLMCLLYRSTVIIKLNSIFWHRIRFSTLVLVFTYVPAKFRNWKQGYLIWKRQLPSKQLISV
jgi:hypothetical protein